MNWAVLFGLQGLHVRSQEPGAGKQKLVKKASSSLGVFFGVLNWSARDFQGTPFTGAKIPQGTYTISQGASPHNV
jgi:hypothetical protein